MNYIKEVLERISPVLISPKSTSLTLSISKRFFLFELMNKLVDTIEEDPELNFIALLKSYKILGKFLHGTIHEFYRDRNNLYFKNFFYDRKLYEIVKADLEYFYPKYKETHKDMKMTITKKGVIIYDNYKKNAFNVLLTTIHSGTWIPEFIEKKMLVSSMKRHQEQDLDTHKIYSPLVLEKGGIWIDNKQSRFLIDFNRDAIKAIYKDRSEDWIDQVWKEEPTEKEKVEIFKSYHEFYFTLGKLLETYQFNIIFDGHSMNGLPKRPMISFATDLIPKFYLPIVKGMQKKMLSMKYVSVNFNDPYKSGNIIRWLSEKYPSAFVFSMEVNKKLYTTNDSMKSYQNKIEKLAKDIPKIFEIEDENELS
ncbi:MAG: N-formylglutamate amidohydrolase [Candidatus Woesearchaeota archaeon]